MTIEIPDTDCEYISGNGTFTCSMGEVQFTVIRVCPCETALVDQSVGGVDASHTT